MLCKIKILGTKYKIKFVKNIKIDGEDCEGFIDPHKKEILICKELPHYKITLRHEIIHAFLHQSGLDVCSVSVKAWAKNEEMVDWIAIQSSKIFKAFKKARAI